jgi:hypothetical protein
VCDGTVGVIGIVVVQVHWELSGATVAGEGEVKVLGRLVRPWPHVLPGDKHSKRGGGRGDQGNRGAWWGGLGGIRG